MTSRTHHSNDQQARRLPWVALTLAALAFVSALQVEAQIVTGTTITVNSISDGFIINPPGSPRRPHRAVCATPSRRPTRTWR